MAFEIRMPGPLPTAHCPAKQAGSCWINKRTEDAVRFDLCSIPAGCTAVGLNLKEYFSELCIRERTAVAAAVVAVDVDVDLVGVLCSDGLNMAQETERRNRRTVVLLETELTLCARNGARLLQFPSMIRPFEGQDRYQRCETYDYIRHLPYEYATVGGKWQMLFHTDSNVHPAGSTSTSLTVDAGLKPPQSRACLSWNRLAPASP